MYARSHLLYLTALLLVDQSVHVVGKVLLQRTYTSEEEVDSTVTSGAYIGPVGIEPIADDSSSPWPYDATQHNFWRSPTDSATVSGSKLLQIPEQSYATPPIGNYSIVSSAEDFLELAKSSGGSGVYVMIDDSVQVPNPTPCFGVQ